MQKTPQNAHLVLLLTSAIMIDKMGIGNVTVVTQQTRVKIRSGPRDPLMFVLNGRIYECDRGLIPELDGFQEMVGTERAPGENQALADDWYVRLMTKAEEALLLLDR